MCSTGRVCCVVSFLVRDILISVDLFCMNSISNEFVHLDVKPANILVKKQHFKLGDFGLALHTIDGKFQGNVEEGDSRWVVIAGRLIALYCTLL